LEVSLAVDQGIDDIQQEGRGQQAEEPRTARVEILFIAFIVSQAIGEQQRAQEEENHAIADDEGIGPECPTCCCIGLLSVGLNEGPVLAERKPCFHRAILSQRLLYAHS